MSAEPFSLPVREDSVPKTDDIAVGEDLEFQRRWWVFERFVWSFFLLILIADAAGVFGRGWAAKATRSDPANIFSVDYERVQRNGTPSTMTIRFTPRAVENGSISLYVSDSLIQLGAQRIDPQPSQSSLTPDGVVYKFPSSAAPATVEFQLQPSSPGQRHFRMALGNSASPQSIDATILVLP